MLILNTILSCTPLAETNYTKLRTRESSKKSISEAIKDKNPINLPLNIEYTSYITEKDPVIQIPDSISFLSNYKLFRSKAVEGKKYTLTVYTTYDWTEYGDYIFTPGIRLVNCDETHIECKLSKNKVEVKNTFGKLSHRIIKEWEYSIKNTGEYNILIFSDNKVIGIPIGNIQFKPIKTNIFGVFMITVAER